MIEASANGGSSGGGGNSDGGGRRGGRNSRRRGGGGGGGNNPNQQNRQPQRGPQQKQASQPGQSGQQGGQQPRRHGPGGGNSGQSGRNRPQRSSGGGSSRQQPQQSQKQPAKQKFSRMDPRYQWDEKAVQPSKVADKKLTYKILVYDTFAEAKADLEKLRTTAASCDKLNIVVKQEGNMDDPDLTPFGKVFAGAAWTLIHERRIEDGWYTAPQ